jgi:hypothetical protein
MMLGRIAQIYGRTCGVADTVLLKWLQLTGGSGGEAPPSPFLEVASRVQNYGPGRPPSVGARGNTAVPKATEKGS